MSFSNLNSDYESGACLLRLDYDKDLDQLPRKLFTRGRTPRTTLGMLTPR